MISSRAPGGNYQRLFDSSFTIMRTLTDRLKAAEDKEYYTPMKLLLQEARLRIQYLEQQDASRAQSESLMLSRIDLLTAAVRGLEDKVQRQDEAHDGSA